MKRRTTTDPLAPLLPVARMTAVGFVVVVATLAAVHVGTAKPTPTLASDSTSTTIAATTRPAEETVPAAAKLVAVPQIPGPDGRDGTSATFTDQVEINRVAAIIDALPTRAPGTYSCPNDTGGGLQLNFESSGGTVLAQVEIRTSGCGGAYVTTHGTQQPGLSAGPETTQQIQDTLGTHWQLTQTMP